MIALAFALLVAFGSQHPSDLGLAERAYRAGNYGEARGHFEAALSRPGVPAGPVLFNLGNCAYRLGRHADALLYYRRARLDLPRDHEVAFNLSLAEQQLGLDGAEDPSLLGALVALCDSFTPRELLVLVGLLQGAGLLGWVCLRGRPGARLAMGALVVLGLLGGARLVQVQWFPEPPAGVVLGGRVAVRAEPHDGAAVNLELSAGETVRVEERSDRWLRIVHRRGSGWAARGVIGVVE